MISPKMYNSLTDNILRDDAIRSMQINCNPAAITLIIDTKMVTKIELARNYAEMN